MVLIVSQQFSQLFHMSLITKMRFFSKGLKAKVMSTELIIEANVSKKVLFEALDLVKAFEAKYSAYKPDSLLSQINKASGENAVQCSEIELEIFSHAIKIAKQSNGFFDPTIGVLTQGTYGFGTNRAKLPSKTELLKQKKLVNYNDCIINDESIFLQKKGMRLDLGGIGKGYIADKIMDFLIENGATKVLLSVGGEICSYGKKYNIALQNPFSKQNIAVIKTSKQMLSISTSGDYERFITSKENHHILDNTTAKPNHYHSSITIIKDGLYGATLDAVATIAFNSKQEDLYALAKKFEVAIIAISPQKSLQIENFSGLSIESFEMFSL